MTEKNIEKILKKLFTDFFFEKAYGIRRIKGGVSERNVYKIYSNNYVCTGVYNAKLNENTAFIEFSKSFKDAGLNVPEIYSVSENGEFYIEEFLGEKSLYDIINNKKIFSGEKIQLYKNALSDLIQFQIKGKDAINFRYCYETKSFDRKQITFDFKKFSNYYLNELNCNSFSKTYLKNILSVILKKLLSENQIFFMYRDFQPRNIMYRDGKLYYIDYQSGRRGPLHYDLASFLYSGSINLNEIERKKLLNYYIKELSKCIKINPAKFKASFYYFAFIRLIQVLGSYGYLYEREKDEVIFKKILKALNNIKSIKKNLKEKTLVSFAEEISNAGLKSIRTSKHR